MTSNPADSRRRHRRWPWIVGLAAGAVVAGFLTLRWVLRDTATPVPVADAVEEFRDDREAAGLDPADSSPPASSTSTTPDPDQPEPGDRSTIPDDTPALPATGVYVYETAGFEEIDALGGAHHDYPATTTVTVRDGGCGVTHRWDALEERFEEWETCRTRDGALVMPRYTSFHRFFGTDDRRDFVCDRPITLVHPEPAAAKVDTVSCRAGDLFETVIVTVEGTEQVAVRSTAVETVHVDLAIAVAGSSNGSFAADLWLTTADGLLVRWTETGGSSTGAAVGEVSYEEELALSLTATEPQR